MAGCLDATKLLSMRHVPDRKKAGQGVCRDRRLEIEPPGRPIHRDRDSAVLPLAKHRRLWTSQDCLAALLKVEGVDINGVVTTGFDLSKPGLSANHYWNAKIERPRSTWRTIDMAQHLDGIDLLLFRGNYKEDDFSVPKDDSRCPKKNSRFFHITSLIYGSPTIKQFLGVPQDAPLIRGQRHRQCRALHCGWCAEHVHKAFRNHASELRLDKLWESGACTRCDASCLLVA